MYAIYITLDGFYVTALGQSDRCLVVHHEGQVLDSCERARVRNVRPGTALSEAKAVLREEGEFFKLAQAEFAQAAEGWLDVCALWSSVIEPGLPHEAWVCLSAHPDPARTAGELASSLTRHLPGSIGVYAGCASSKWVARRAALPCDRALASLGVPPFVRECSDSEFIADWPVEWLDAVPVEVRERLAFLGYRSVGSLRSAPPALLRQQFGREAALVMAACRGDSTDRVAAVYPPGSVSVVRSYQGGLADTHALDESLGGACRELALLLSREEKTGDELWLHLEPEDGEVCVQKRRLVRPSRSASVLLTSARQALGAMCLKSPVRQVRLTMPRLRAVVSVQRALIGQEVDDRKAAAEQTEAAVRAAYGQSAVQVASSMKPERRVELLRVWKRATGWC